MKHFDLNGEWSLKRADQDELLPAQVPGCVHTDLLAAGKIDDPFYRDNEDRIQWISDADWVYSRTFEVSAEMLSYDHVLLRCEGLDTLATLTLNGRRVGRGENMFRTWEMNVRDALRRGENRLEVRLASPFRYVEERRAQRALPEWAGPKEAKGRAWLRKEPCNFGWDWGPVMMTSGIWRPIRLVAFNLGRITDIAIRQKHSEGHANLTVTVTAEVLGDADLSAAARLVLDGQTVTEASEKISDGMAQLRLHVSDPKLWWPNGMGAQPLYAVEVQLLNDAGEIVDDEERRVGIRTLRLDRHPDKWGESFQFVVNGVPFFAKGANWIPADSFATRMTGERYADLLQSAVDANMNMIRVWGGGIYEDDIFYNICDELGLCVWQDFMFACSAYPTFDKEFLRNVRAEAEDNVRRLRHHACIALWCGNNELEQGLVGDEWTDTQMSWKDYGELFDDLLPAVVKELDPDRDYWPSSPHTSCGDRGNFNDPTCGDAHLWSVWHGRKPFEWYRTCDHRFNSEFGFQSFPEPKTTSGYTEPADRNITSYVMEHHQRSGQGNTLIMHYLLDWFRLPTSFEMTLWLSQILQGMAMKYAVEHWRRAMPRGMGTLYWQLNDTWPGASWSSIDYYGRWKAVHFMAKRFYASLLMSGVENVEDGKVEVHVTNDLLKPIKGRVRWRLTDVTGNLLLEDATEFDAPPQQNAVVSRADVKQFLEQLGKRDLLFWLELEGENGGKSSDVVLFARPKHLELPEPGIRWSMTDVAGGTYALRLEAERPALWVWASLSEDDARFSDNFVHLFPGESQEIIINPKVELTRGQIEGQLLVASLVDTYR